MPIVCLCPVIFLSFFCHCCGILSLWCYLSCLCFLLFTRNRNNQRTTTIGYHGHTFDKYSQSGHFVSNRNNTMLPVKPTKPGYYPTTERPWQSTRPLPDPLRRDSRNFAGLPNNAHLAEHINPEVKYHILDPGMVLLMQEAPAPAMIHDYQNASANQVSVAI